MSRKKRSRLAISAITTPPTVPTMRPMSAFFPVIHAASWIRWRWRDSCSRIAVGFGIRYGLTSRATIHHSHSPSTTAPTMTGGMSIAIRRRHTAPDERPPPTPGPPAGGGATSGAATARSLTRPPR
jgi:hypothetical protein